MRFRGGIQAVVLCFALFWAPRTVAGAPAGGDGFVLDLRYPTQSLEEILVDVEKAHALGARHFTVPIHLCQSGGQATVVEWCYEDGGRYKARLEMLAGELKVRGFTTGFLTLIIARDHTWRGEFEPRDFRAWSASYLERLDELTAIAERAAINDFAIASELSRLYLGERAAFWRAALGRVRARLSATSVFFVANWDQWDKIRFWDASDYVGLSAYFPLASSERESPSVDELVHAWRPWAGRLVELSRRVGRPLYFAEVGYPSMANAAAKPWSYAPVRPLALELQARCFEAFGRVWGDAREVAARSLARFTLWALSVPPEPLTDTGYGVIGKPGAEAVRGVFRARAGLRGEPDPRGLEVVFTIDDIPMWYVSGIDERLAAYRVLRETLARHRVPAVAFVNPAGIRDEREWDELRGWARSGVVFANHTARHVPLSATTDTEFLSDVREGGLALDQQLPDWDAVHRFFRYPNLDYGGTARARGVCEAIRAQGYAILPTSFDTRDWSWGHEYHEAAASDLERRSNAGAAARTVASRALATIDAQLDEAYRNARTEPMKSSAAVLMMHSTRFGRDYLDHILTRLESRGVRWVAPTPERMRAYLPGLDCLPACRGTGQCY